MKTALSAGAAALLSAVLLSQAAQAIPRTFVSAAGSGTACSRTAPCATFQAAHDATDAGGEINCIDAGNFAVPGSIALTISKSITIDCAGTLGSISGFANFGISINTPGVVVRLRNLTIDATGASVGILVSDAAVVFIERCVVVNGSSTNPFGISFGPSSGLAKLFVSDTIIGNNRVGNSSGAGVDIAPIAGAFARVIMDRVRVEKNRTGIFVDPPQDPSQANVVHIRNSVVAGSLAEGISAQGAALSPGGVTSVTIDRTSFLLNGSNGIHSSAGGFVLLGRSEVIGNGTGLSVTNGGNILSYQNNHATGNVSDGAPTATLTLK